MSTLAISPPNGAYDLSPTSPILVVGYAPGEVFDYPTLSVTINSSNAYYDGEAVRPAFSARLVASDESFTLTIVPRRAFLYRVKINVGVAIDSNSNSYLGTTSFTTRAKGLPLVVSAMRSSIELPLPPDVAFTSVAQQLRALLGGNSSSEFALRMIYRARLSQLWPALSQLLDKYNGNLERALAAMSDDDVAIRGDMARVLGLIEIFWEPAISQFIAYGASRPLADLIGRAFRSQNDLERVAAACTLLLSAATVYASDGDGLAAKRASGVL